MATRQMLATVCTAPGVLEVRQRPVPEVGPEDVLVRVRNCGICGTDQHFVRDPRVVQRGIAPGHEFVGEVVAVGGEVAWPKVGDPVAIEPLATCRTCDYCRSGHYNHCQQRSIFGFHRDGGFAEYVLAPAYCVRALPKGLEWEVAALAEPLAVCYHGVRLAQVTCGDRVLVVGAGTIGLLTLVVARAVGAGEIVVTARYPHQAEAARALGADHEVGGDEESLKALEAEARSRPFHKVFETVGGNGDALRQGLRLAGPEATVCILGVHFQDVPLRPVQIVGSELRVIGSNVYSADDGSTDFDRAVTVLARYHDDLRRIITHRLPLREVARGLAVAGDKKTQSIKVTISPDL